MNTFKNKRALVVALVLFSILLSSTVFAGYSALPYVQPEKDVDILAILNRVINWMYGLLVVVAGAFILYAAFIYLTSGGDPKAVASAKNYIFYTVVAVAVAFFARAIVYIVRQLLGA